MPSKYAVKEYATGQYYHVFNRGVAKQPIFLDSQDKIQFMKILQRHLDPLDTSTRGDGAMYRKFNHDIELLCYCLMGNHFHLLFYTAGEGRSLAVFMQSVLTAYTMYFNKKHKRVGTLFQGVFKASRISSEAYLVHISRYIHLNPRLYKNYKFSSISYYLLKKLPPNWLHPERILALFEGENYMRFLEDYEEQKAVLDVLKHELADR